ncbi:MAG: dienelactone hydrolase family protein [Hyphomonadaceae bacterium]|nr:MAG: carboxymethylenebutenolidase [Caulobacteraceae bacterium]MBT9447469.1 dienelactone hydrolase family protein [Hyphomonadaceae bacterium]TPW08478.1 MAG: carboxymethylenebutenolidase [Alphaproteobacteria bacterium]
MCDEHTEADNAAQARDGNVSRRGFAALAGGALAACASGPTVDGETLAVSERDVTITMADGVCDAHFVHPVRGKHPAVIVWPDIRGLRPAFRQMGKRLAESGYAVLTVNQFYRAQKAPVVQAGESFSDPAVRGRLMPMAQALNAATAAMDATAFIGFLDAQASVDTRRRIGTAGYCMGGPLVMRTASVSERIGAGASFHGGGLATDQPTSPHLLIPQMKASFLIAVAQNDDARTPQEKETLRAAFAAQGLAAEIEVYPAQHGWCPPDSPVYDEAQAERAWSRMLALFAKALV